MNTTQPRNNMVTSQEISNGGEAMNMRLRKGRWYSLLRHPNNWKKLVEVSLDAYEQEKRKAIINLGKLLQDLERGIDPISSRLRVEKIKIEGPISDRIKGSLKHHIYPFFGEYKPREITKEVIEKYMVHRWGRDDNGGLQGPKSTLDKELGALRLLIKQVEPSYKLPALNYTKIEKEILEPLTYSQIEMVGNLLSEKYKAVYWVMAYTGMDVSDAVYLKPSHFKDGWIDKPRGKTKQKIVVPVLDALQSILQTVPWPLDKTVGIFPDINPKAVTTAVITAFRAAGLKGYGAKYLRRYIGSALLDAGYSMDWIGKALAHADGSRITQRYTKVYKQTLGEAFQKVEERRINVGTGLSKSE
jgi:integrase